MKKNKKVFFKNRVKCFYTEPGSYDRNRIGQDKESFNLQGGNGKEEEEDSENPEEESDLS